MPCEAVVEGCCIGVVVCMVFAAHSHVRLAVLGHDTSFEPRRRYPEGPLCIGTPH